HASNTHVNRRRRPEGPGRSGALKIPNRTENILHDENLPEALIETLRRIGHIVDSVGSLRLKGLDNGRLYREVASGYDLFFTKDRQFVAQLDAVTEPSSVKVVLAIIRQQPEVQFVASFMKAFVGTDWLTSGRVREWPS